MVEHNSSLSVQIGPLTLRNPVLTASGTFGYGQEMAPFVEMSRLGGVVCKTVTRHPRAGNPPPRTCETASGMLNAIGLQNVGIERFIAEKLPFLRDFDVPLIVNIAGESVEDFAFLARALSDADGVAAVELNISCPNVAHGLDFATDPALTEEVVAHVRASTHLPVFTKLSPNVTDITLLARAAERGRFACFIACKYLCWYGDRHENKASAPFQYQWRPEWTGYQAFSFACRFSLRTSRRYSNDWHRRHYDSQRRHRVFVGRSHRRSDRNS